MNRTLMAFGALAVSALHGCVVKDELRDGLRQMRADMKALTLTRSDDGGAQLDFTFEYGLALVDDGGVSEIPWRVRLMDANRVVYATLEQTMRKAEPTETRALVTGERKRTIEIEPGVLPTDERPYAVWVVAEYEDETLHEALWPVNAVGP